MLKMGFFVGSNVRNLQKAQDIAEKKAPTCLRCKDQPMEIGYQVQVQAGLTLPQMWFKSKPEGWINLRAMFKEYLCVVSFRCPTCGYLENYAPDITE